MRHPSLHLNIKHSDTRLRDAHRGLPWTRRGRTDHPVLHRSERREVYPSSPGIANHSAAYRPLTHLALFGNGCMVEIKSRTHFPSTYRPSDLDYQLRQHGPHPSVRELSLRCGSAFPLFHIFPNVRILRPRYTQVSFEYFDWQERARADLVPLIDVTVDNNGEFVCLAGLCLPVFRQLYLL